MNTLKQILVYQGHKVNPKLSITGTLFLNSLAIAGLRSLKLLRLKQIGKFFETKEIENQVRKTSLIMSMRTI
jgi:hypothetical protein